MVTDEPDEMYDKLVDGVPPPDVSIPEPELDNILRGANGVRPYPDYA